MSSIMRARSALTGRWEESEVIGGSSLKPKVAGPSMLGIGCPDRHALLLTHPPPSPKMYRSRRPSSRESGFVLRRVSAGGAAVSGRQKMPPKPTSPQQELRSDYSMLRQI